MALIDKASLLMVPSTYEAGKLYNVLPSGNRAPDQTGENSGYDQTRADFDFDRGSNTAATRIGSDGLIKKYRENLLLQSNQFDTTWLNQLGGTITSGQSGYDGSSNAWLISKSASNFKSVRQVISFSGVTTFSVYAKAGTLTKAALRMDTSAGAVQIIYDLSAGVVSSSGGVFISRGIENIGNGWYRIFVSVNVSSGTNVHIYVDRDGTTAGSIYIQNAQLESGLVATDYLNSTSVTGKAGVLIDLPRIDYSSGAGALLLEPSRQQLVRYSEYFNGWTYKDAISIETNTNETTSPDGLYNASKMVESATTGTHRVFEGISGTNKTLSFFAKAGGRDWVNVLVDNGGYVFFNVATGEKGVQQSGSPTTIEDYGNGWYRCSVYNFHPTYALIGVSSADNTQSYTGDGTSAVYLYGAQVEAGSYSTSYIPNHGESGGVTRAADSCSVTGASDVIGQTEGTMYWEVDFGANDSAEYPAVFLYDGTSNNRILIQRRGNNQLLQYQINAGGSNQVDEFSTTAVGSGKVKIAIAYKANDFVLYLNGSQEASDTSGSTFSGALSQIAFQNTRHDNTYQLALFKERLSNAELAALTA